MLPALRIIRPSGREKENFGAQRVVEFEKAGWRLLCDTAPEDADWPFTAGSAKHRALQLLHALKEPNSTAVLCARGGYGASDLLEYVPWDDLRKIPPKPLVGYSDISALHSALFTRAGWPSIHGPMPFHASWNTVDEAPDIDSLWKMLRGEGRGAIPVREVYTHPVSGELITGMLFGGCLSVLTALIGTPFFPKNLAGTLLFLEDTGEHPARILRYWNQWIQCGTLQGVRAVVFGRFVGCRNNETDFEEWLIKELAGRCPVPVLRSESFGHVTPNFPLPIGATGQIAAGHLSWTTSPFACT